MGAWQQAAPGRAAGPGALRRRREQEIVRVEVVRARYFFDTYYAGNTVPQTETVHARADVGGTAEPVSETRRDRGQDPQCPPTGPMARSDLGNVPTRPVGRGNTTDDYLTENMIRPVTEQEAAR